MLCVLCWYCGVVSLCVCGECCDVPGLVHVVLCMVYCMVWTCGMVHVGVCRVRVVLVMWCCVTVCVVWCMVWNVICGIMYGVDVWCDVRW